MNEDCSVLLLFCGCDYPKHWGVATRAMIIHVGSRGLARFCDDPVLQGCAVLCCGEVVCAVCTPATTSHNTTPCSPVHRGSDTRHDYPPPAVVSNDACAAQD